jgi:hypothetical protein
MVNKYLGKIEPHLLNVNRQNNITKCLAILTDKISSDVLVANTFIKGL